MQRASVVLPEPDSPTTATQDSGKTSRSTPDRTGVRPYPADTVRSDNAAAGSAGAGPATTAARCGLAAAISATRMHRTVRPSMRTGCGGWARHSPVA